MRARKPRGYQPGVSVVELRVEVFLLLFIRQNSKHGERKLGEGGGVYGSAERRSDVLVVLRVRSRRVVRGAEESHGERIFVHYKIKRNVGTEET